MPDDDQPPFELGLLVDHAKGGRHHGHQQPKQHVHADDCKHQVDCPERHEARPLERIVRRELGRHEVRAGA